MPSGRDIHSTKPYRPPSLDEDTLARMRAPPDPTHLGRSTLDDSSSDSDDGGSSKKNHGSALPGAFPASGLQSDTYY